MLLLLGSPLSTDFPEDYPLTDEYIDIRQEDLASSMCTCTDYVNENGVGNCTGEGEKRFNNEPVCYVSLPSNCPDIKISTTDGGKFLSAMACKTTNYLLNSINPRILGEA